MVNDKMNVSFFHDAVCLGEKKLCEPVLQTARRIRH